MHQEAPRKGTSIKDRLSKYLKLSAGNHVKDGANRVGKDACDLMKDRRLKKVS